MRIRFIALAVAMAAVTAFAGSLLAQEQSVAQLIKKFEATDDFAQKTTMIKYLARHSDPRGPLYLGKVFADQEDVVIRMYIVERLAEAGTDGAGEALLECGSDGDEQVRAAYKKAIVGFVEKPGFDHMIEVGLLKKKGEKYAPVRKFLAEILGNIQYKGAIKILKKALRDKDWEIRLMAAESLCEIGSEDAVREACRAVEDDRAEVAVAVLDMLEGFEVAKYINYIMKGLYHDEPVVRARALEVLAGQTDRRLVRKVVEMVADEDERVRRAAVESLKWTQNREVIEGLIDDLKNATGDKKDHIGEALAGLTREDFGTDHGKWRAWFDEKGASAPLAQPPRPTTSVGKATYYGTAVSSKAVIFIIDVSGSMSEQYVKKAGRGGEIGGTTLDPDKKSKGRTVTKIEVAKKELIRCLKKLERDVSFNIIFYNEIFSAWKRSDDGSGSRIIPATPRNKRDAIKFVMAFSPSGRTNIFDSLEFAMKDKDADTIYLLSDGMPNEGRIKDTDGIVSEITSMNKHRTPRAIINTIGFGLRDDGKAFLKRLAEQNSGVFLDM